MKRLFLLLSLLTASCTSAVERPNVVLVMTDDQGYGDVSCHGHPYIQTPNIDKLSKESLNFSDFHVFPTCSPTRAALMTGHWANRTGVWHTINGRSLIRKNEITIASLLKTGGYRSGIFGKWHLGDAYPFRPEDRGFDEVYVHGGGGVGQTPDLWDNAYFDDRYFHNGEVVRAKGFCTDVFFAEAQRFVRECVKKKEPFFTYIAPNAPHSPNLCPQKYMDLYPQAKGNLKAFFGMITNIDENLGMMRDLLKELGVEENTIFIFMTDNGTAAGADVWNAGMRGRKNSEYDGGHRVPLIIHWPAKNLTEYREVKTLAHVVDIVPTLLELCDVKAPASLKFDGLSLAPLILDPVKKDWPERMVITDSQRVEDPVKWRKCAVMSQDWRLVNGKELFYLPDDPGQEKDIASEHPARVKAMRDHYDAWWADLEPGYKVSAEFILGHEDAPETTLTAHDWIGGGFPPWNQWDIRAMKKFIVDDFKGFWPVEVVEGGSYTFKLRRWPAESGLALSQGVEKGASVPGTGPAYRETAGYAMPIVSGTVALNGKVLKTVKAEAGAKEITISADLPKGTHQLSAYFALEDGRELGTAYLTVAE